MLSIKKLHLIQKLHLGNTLIGVVDFALLVGVSNHISRFITGGALIAGFGNFTTFAYPATYVFMLIPVISATIYSAILACDYSATYPTWLPSKTLRTSIFLFTFALFLGALFPLIDGADVMTEGSTLECHWTQYMQWEVIYGNPAQFPWVTGMATACSLLKVAVAFNWILFIGWLSVSYLYIKSTLSAQAIHSKR